MADFENVYGNERPLVSMSYQHTLVSNGKHCPTSAKHTFVHPFMLDVMITCGTNRDAPALSFHFSSSGRNANVSQYGPTALVLKDLSKSSCDTGSKYVSMNA